MIVPSRATLVSGQDAPGAVAELGDPGMHSRLGARGTLLGLPQSAQLLGAPRALSPPCPSAPTGGAELRGRAPTNPPLLGGPSRHSSASALCVCQRGSSDSFPFLGVYRFSSPHKRRGATRKKAAACTTLAG